MQISKIFELTQGDPSENVQKKTVKIGGLLATGERLGRFVRKSKAVSGRIRHSTRQGVKASDRVNGYR